jgi:hypothetical protein
MYQGLIINAKNEYEVIGWVTSTLKPKQMLGSGFHIMALEKLDADSWVITATLDTYSRKEAEAFVKSFPIRQLMISNGYDIPHVYIRGSGFLSVMTVQGSQLRIFDFDLSERSPELEAYDMKELISSMTFARKLLADT